MQWRKSSYSANNGSCVEVAWTKSSFSTNNGACVEVAALPGLVLTRDSKNTDGPVLTFTRSDWAAFLSRLAQTG